jgi:23S rRNA (guanosine2251-2'-O)-methyltransferase
VESNPRRRFITIYGRMPVLEALADERVELDKVLVAHGARGQHVDDIVATARRRGLRVEWTSPARVTRISRNGRHDQGVVADVVAPGLAEVDDWLAGAGREGPAHLLLLDGLTNPANVGMIIRTATAAGLAGVVLPRFASADVGPLVVKASAGTVFRATVLRSDTSDDAAGVLSRAGFEICGMRGEDADSLFSVTTTERAVFVLGNETEGVSPAVARMVTQWVSLPLFGGVESLNVAAAAAVLAYELARRRLAR